MKNQNDGSCPKISFRNSGLIYFVQMTRGDVSLLPEKNPLILQVKITLLADYNRIHSNYVGFVICNNGAMPFREEHWVMLQGGSACGCVCVLGCHTLAGGLGRGGL